MLLDPENMTKREEALISALRQCVACIEAALEDEEGWADAAELALVRVGNVADTELRSPEADQHP